METELSADKKVEQLSEEELHCVLKQLTDHNIPEKDKCPLVQRLNAEEKQSKEKVKSNSKEKDWVDDGGGCGAGGAGAGCAGVCSSGSSHSLSSHPANHPAASAQSQSSRERQAANYAQPMQEPRSNNNNCDDSQNLRAAISNKSTEIVASASHLRSSSNRKPNRANSFTMPSSDNLSKSDTCSLKILDHRLTNGTEVSPQSKAESLRAGADKQTINRHHMQSAQSSQSPQSASVANGSARGTTRRPPRSNSSHSPSDTSADQHFHLSSQSTSGSLSNSYSSVHLANISSLVDSISGDSVPNYPRLLSENRSLKSNNQSLTVQEEDEEKLEFGEMKELQSQAQFIEYRKNLNLPLKDSNQEHYNVDKRIDMPMLSSGGLSDENAAFTSFPGLPANNNTSSMPSPHSSFYNLNNNNSIGNNTNINSRQYKKKRQRKSTKEEVKLAQEIDGFMGYMDIDTLVQKIVNAKPSSTNNSMAIDKKSKGKTIKSEIETTKRQPKRSNGEMKTNQNGDENVASASNNKVSLSSVSNSSSLSGDDAAPTGVMQNSKSNVSPELPNGIRSKKSKSKKEKQDKPTKGNTNKKVANSTAAGHDNSKVSGQHGASKEANKSEKAANSSSDATDTEEDLPIPYRLMKSNSLLPSKTADTPPEEDNPCTVSDSEMADREKGWDTPKQKKKRKGNPAKFQHPNTINHPNPKYPGYKNSSYNTTTVHNLARGYESEREYSLNQNFTGNSFATQTLSSSLHAINSRTAADKRAVSNLSQATNHDNADILSQTADDLLDGDFVELHPAPCDTQDSGPKMPSYADIAKSFNQPASSNTQSKGNLPASTGASAASASNPTTAVSPPKPSSQVTNNSPSPGITEDFPQLLNSRSPELNNFAAHLESANSSIALPTMASKPKPAPIAEDEPLEMNGDSFEAMRVDGQQSTPTVSPSKSENSSCTNEPPESVSDSTSTGTSSLQQANCSKDDVGSPKSGDSGLPAISFGDSGESSFAEEDNTIYCDQQPPSYINGDSKLVFGFFEDSELSMIKESDFCPLDPTMYSSKGYILSTSQDVTNADLNGPNDDVNSMGESAPQPPNGTRFDNFYKNALHVDELEDHFRKLDYQSATEQPHPSNPATYSSSAQSQLSSSIDSSSALSTVPVSPVQPHLNNSQSAAASSTAKPFVSCVNELSNYRFVDNVDQNSFNYKNILDYVYKAWNQCQGL